MSLLRPLVLLVVCLASHGFTPAMAETGAVFATDSNAPISVEANKMTVFKNGARAELLGRAALNQGPLSLTADEVTLFYTALSPRQLTRITAEKNVRIVSQNGREVFGDKAVYRVNAEKMTVSGNVRVIDTTNNGEDKSETNTLSGGRLVINMRDGTSQVEGDESAGGGRARIELTPNGAR